MTENRRVKLLIGQEESDLLLVSTFEADANFLPTMIVGLQDIQFLSWIE